MSDTERQNDNDSIEVGNEDESLENSQILNGENQFEEGETYRSKTDLEFFGEKEESEGSRSGDYDEPLRYSVYRRDDTGEHGLWDQLSAPSDVSRTASEVEETEEEKEQRKEREKLIEKIRRKLMDRALLRRKNLFLEKKLVDHFKKRRMEHVLKEETKGIDLEIKYLKRLYTFQDFKQAHENEIEELASTMEKCEMETKDLAEEVKEKMKSFVVRAKEVSLNLISTKTGKKINEKTVDRLLRRINQKNEEKGKKKLQYIEIKNLIDEKEKLLKAMEYFGDGLHIADYEQMKIDNQNYTDKIEEKEDELTKMRYKTQGIIQNLTHVKEKAYAIEGDIEIMKAKVYEVENKFAEMRKRLTNARKRRDSLREEFTRLKNISGLLTRDNLLRDYEESILEAKNLEKSLEKMKKMIQEKNKKQNALAKIISTSKNSVPKVSSNRF